MKTKKALIYVRVASPIKTDEYIKQQAKMCQEFCVKHDLEYEGCHRFVGIGDEMSLTLATVTAESKNKPDVVVVPSYARISRNKANIEKFVNTLKAAGVAVCSATETTSL